MTATLDEVYERLLQAYGPQGWWPGESPFEVMVGAVLVQNTAWQNVEKAIANLRDDNLLDVMRLWQLPREQLETLIKPAGYFRLKAARLRNLLAYVVERHDGSLDSVFALSMEELRSDLLEINGIGPETADSILLYAADKPRFVVDAYTQRVLKRHGWIDQEADYGTTQSHFETHLEPDTQLYGEYHALLVRVGHHHCRKTPRCEACPLAEWLPADGIRLPD
ncbi:MAG: endonuclease III domain-containing protein [Planctomycetota bacterium]|nr:MAG: endonuclease III domain-containing protein [Planctomycetota bacterium]REJ89957.1 MAG: endonuclease III domain-containing protein [Planctomycetota bacterium]REK28189.1 MAG: endonuclease III domain-containing protein [Planctomycetota bacterium]REK42447.1 MAG: endonuclease III domain-containing protein [Planctomycetota bacterium]